jgi:hypothetical protein
MSDLSTCLYVDLLDPINRTIFENSEGWARKEKQSRPKSEALMIMGHIYRKSDRCIQGSSNPDVNAHYLLSGVEVPLLFSGPFFSNAEI